MTPFQSEPSAPNQKPAVPSNVFRPQIANPPQSTLGPDHLRFEDSDFEVHLPPGFRRLVLLEVTGDEMRSAAIQLEPRRLKSNSGADDSVRGTWKDVLGRTVQVFRYFGWQNSEEVFTSVQWLLTTSPATISSMSRIATTPTFQSSGGTIPEECFELTLNGDGKESKVWGAIYVNFGKRFFLTLTQEECLRGANFELAAKMASYLFARFRIKASK